MRTISALVVATGLVISLAACSSTPAEQLAACSPAVGSGSVSDLVSTTGGGSAEPTVSFPTPLVAKSTQRTIETTGDGAILSAGDIAEIQLTQVNGADAAVIGSSYEAGSQLYPVGDEDFIAQILACTPIGSRIVATVPVSEFAETTDKAATAVFVIDVIDGFNGKADGTPQLGQNGLPSIVTAPDGTPGFTFTGSDAPEKIRTELLQKGDGAKVAEGDKIVIQFTGVTWTDETKLTSTWDSRPLRTNASSEDTVDNDASLYLPGTAKLELVGEKVGSQLIIAVPAALGFEGGGGIAEGETVVYVVDILAIQK